MTAEVNEMADLLGRAGAARAAGDLGTAGALYAEAAARWPDQPEPHHHLAGIHRVQGRLDLAEAEYRRTLELAPDALGTRRVLGTVLLSQGRFREGFALAEARHALPGMTKPDLAFPEWRGEPIAGRRLLIWPEQGYGDQIQFARFAPVLRQMGAEVTLVCAPPLARLFAGSLGVQVLAAQGAVEFPDPDYWAMCGNLPGPLGCTVESLPNQPYLRALEPAPARTASARIGLKTSGNPAHENDLNRSLPESAAGRLRAMLPDALDLDPAVTGARDFADTAAIVHGLDLVISVDTAVAHLAGAMGKACWVLLPAQETDWRWMLQRSDSPWYPSITLFRQQPGEGWDPVVGRIETVLSAG